MHNQSLSTNPIKVFLTDLGTNTRLVTKQLLTEINALLLGTESMEQFGLEPVLMFIEYLEEQECVLIKKLNDNCFTITGLHNYGKNVQ